MFSLFSDLGKRESRVVCVCERERERERERDGAIDATNMNISLPEISKDMVHDIRSHEVMEQNVCDVLDHCCAVS